MYKILIADDHPLFREAIHNVISDGFPRQQHHGNRRSRQRPGPDAGA